MSIFLDATEARENTRLPESVISAGHIVTGLEALTGSDLLVSTISTPTLPSKLDPESRPHQIALRKHIASGLLVARKSGRDLTGSIPELSHILHRMLSTGCPLCYLLITGDVGATRDGECVIDGQATGFSYAAVVGVLEYWKIRGGYVTILQRDSLIPMWINGWIMRLGEMSSQPMKQVIRRTPRQVLVGPDWKSILCSFPGIGPANAEDIADECETLALSLCLLSDPGQAGVVSGIGKGRIAAVRKVMGLKANQILALSGPDKLEETTE